MSEIRLEEWQTAEVKTCGSCNHMRRSGGVGGDSCVVKLPCWVATKQRDPESYNNRYTHDTYTCDLWTPKMVNGVVVTFSKVVKWAADSK
jgi:hypothetical protein